MKGSLVGHLVMFTFIIGINCDVGASENNRALKEKIEEKLDDDRFILKTSGNGNLDLDINPRTDYSERPKKTETKEGKAYFTVEGKGSFESIALNTDSEGSVSLVKVHSRKKSNNGKETIHQLDSSVVNINKNGEVLNKTNCDNGRDKDTLNISCLTVNQSVCSKMGTPDFEFPTENVEQCGEYLSSVQGYFKRLRNDPAFMKDHELNAGFLQKDINSFPNHKQGFPNAGEIKDVGPLTSTGQKNLKQGIESFFIFRELQALCDEIN